MKKTNTSVIAEVKNKDISSKLVKQTRAKSRSWRIENGELHPKPVKRLRRISSNVKSQDEQTPQERSLRLGHCEVENSDISSKLVKQTRAKSRSLRIQNGELNPEPVERLRSIPSNLKSQGEQTSLERSLRLGDFEVKNGDISSKLVKQTRTKSRNSRIQNGAELPFEPVKRLRTISSNSKARDEQTPLKRSLRLSHSKTDTLTSSTRCQPKMETDGSKKHKLNSSSRWTGKTPQKKQLQDFHVTAGKIRKKSRKSYPLKTNVKTLTPILSKRSRVLSTPTTLKDRAMVALHPSKVPESLPCRHEEYETIYNFLSRKIKGMDGGFMYIYGIPGAGKTATVERVIKRLQSELNTKKMKKFTFVEINGMHMKRPKDAFCHIWKKLENNVVPANTAKRLLQEKFNASSSNKPLVLLIDEFDMLFDRTLCVVDTILDWIDESKLIVVAVANSKDLIEEISKGSTKSRMFRERLCDVQFKTYTFDQLEEIIHDRLKNNDVFTSEAIQLLARRSAISGDVRLALNLCRRVLAEAGDKDSVKALGALEVSDLLAKIYSDPRIDFITSLSRQEQTLLRAIRDTILITNSSKCSLDENVYKQYKTICILNDLDVKDEFSLLGMLQLFKSYGFLFLSESPCTIHTTISLGHNLDLIQLAFTRQINQK